MKKSILMLLILCVFGWSTGTHAANLVSDPGFENGGASNYFVVNGTTPVTLFGWTFEDSSGITTWDPAHTDKASAYVNALIHGASGSVSQTIATTPGHQYLVTFWLASNGVQAGDLSVSFGGTTGFTQHQNQGSPGDPWTQHSFTATATTTSSVFQLLGQNLDGTYFMDDVSVTDLGAAVNQPPTITSFIATTPTANLVSDPGFENGGIGWVFSDPSNSGSVGLTSGNHTGLLSAYKNVFGDGSGTVSQTITTTPGHSYLVDFWLAPNIVASGTISVSFGNTTGFTRTDLPVSTPWTEYNFIAPATGSSTTFTFAGHVTFGTYFLDDISITDLGAAGNQPPSRILPLNGTGVPVTLTVVGADPDGTIVQAQWDFTGDGSVDQVTTTLTTSFTYTTAGTFHPSVMVVDNGGATASATTTVTIETPIQALNDLKTTVQGLSLKNGQKNSLIGQLDTISASMNQGKISTACSQLKAFINQVKDLVQNKQLDQATGNALISAAQAIKTALGCS